MSRLKRDCKKHVLTGTLLGTPNKELQEYSRNMREYKDPGRYIPIIVLLYSWGSLFGVSSKVPSVLGGQGDPGLRLKNS